MIYMPNAAVLLVEDDPNDLELTLRALKKTVPAPVTQVARDGAEALDYLFCRGKYAQRPPHPLPSVILLDLKLRKVDGLEVLRQVKAHDRFRTIPVVMLTSSPQEKDLQESYRLGVNSYIVKPPDFNVFTETIGWFSKYWLTVNRLP